MVRQKDGLIGDWLGTDSLPDLNNQTRNYLQLLNVKEFCIWVSINNNFLIDLQLIEWIVSSPPKMILDSGLKGHDVTQWAKEYSFGIFLDRNLLGTDWAQPPPDSLNNITVQDFRCVWSVRPLAWVLIVVK